MNDLKIFEHPKFGCIRTLTEDGKTLFCGLDAATALGYANPDGAIRRHCRYPLKRRVWVQTGIKADGTPAMRETDMTFIPEGDLCRLAAKSELPGANEFESWIFDEVIPTILRTGIYSIAPASPRRPPEVSPNGLARLISITRRVMLDMGSSPAEVGAMAVSVLQAWCIPVPEEAFAKQIPGQLCLFGKSSPEGGGAMMYIVQWCGEDGSLQERRFERAEDARLEAETLREKYGEETVEIRREEGHKKPCQAE